MIFQHTIDAVLNGTKTQTSRIVKGGDMESGYRSGSTPHCLLKCNILSVHRNNRLLYHLDNTYAVQPGRGKKAVARIRILQIRLMDVRYISAQGAVDEGFIDIYAFLKVWCKMHDPVGYKVVKPITSLYTVLPRIPLLDRPAERYRAWVLNFELVKS
jgi:hypothetical protein